MPTERTSGIRATLWPRRLIAIRRSLNRSSRMIVLLGLLALLGNVFWVWHDRGPRAATFDPMEIQTWYHPAYVNSVLIAIIMLYAMRQVSRTREKLTPLGYPLLERASHFRGVEVWRSVDPLTRRAVHLYLIKKDSYHAEPELWDALTRSWMRRADRARRVASPHAAQTLDSGFAQGERFYCAIEMPKGMTLEELIRTHGPCPYDRAIFLLAQIAHAVEDAHQNQIFHLGLHPGDIYISHRSANEDWITMALLSFENKPEAEDPRNRDLRQFARLTLGVMTGTWLDPESTPGDPAVQQTMDSAQLPYPVRLVLERCLGRAEGDALPPATEMVRSMWESMNGPGWNNDRAAAWWAEHRNREAEPS